MHRISYAGDTVITGSDISRAVIAYAEALAIRDGSATVDLPIRRADGSNGRASILLGPASELFAQSEPDDGDELVDTELVERLTAATAALSTPRPVASDGDNPVTPEVGEYDILDYDLG